MARVTSYRWWKASAGPVVTNTKSCFHPQISLICVYLDCNRCYNGNNLELSDGTIRECLYRNAMLMTELNWPCLFIHFDFTLRVCLQVSLYTLKKNRNKTQFSLLSSVQWQKVIKKRDRTIHHIHVCLLYIACVINKLLETSRVHCHSLRQER